MKRLRTLPLAIAGALLVLAGHTGATTLAERWNTLRTEQPKAMIRDAARTLGVSEAELLATGIGSTVTLLRSDGNDPREIMRRALDLGTVLALTRNENGVIERTGVATRVKPQPADDKETVKDDEREARQRNIAGGYLGGEIDLRFTFSKWKHAFAVAQPGADGVVKRSLQFFDENGVAIHKIYPKDAAGVAVFDKLVDDFRHPDQNAALTVAARAPKAAELADSKVDVKEFQQAWSEMSDVHQFNRLLAEFKITREQAMRLAPAGMVQRLKPDAVRTLLDEAARQQLPIMSFLGNGAVIQIFSGKITRTAASAGWYNVLDPAFNLHLRESAFKSGWVVRRAGVTSVEFYDNEGEQVVSFFGVRERGQAQPKSWVDLTATLPKG
ncbi:hemin-degrading factor [Massilia antarctica]|uniref:hemin-degrading factor n=1 Tax=Massilia antarctica TaxID=2765360 RepID=UPI0006BB794F|nr:hemin-degrading factor [Massilia sp. H27-R4]MCY0911803.1 hemin-degrading factor [Massilia sp. H27-R4]CUI06743.1 Hemin transport protein HmuS [Janthinobacterium sp. CG23_2]CUU30529.1 Hemin transport protein HmuS [Janthinobacterium sp. CG23_2]